MKTKLIHWFMRHKLLALFIFGIIFFASGFRASVSAYYTNMPANVVIGQQDFTTGSSGTTSSTLNGPAGIFIDPNGRLIVSDLTNNRVLIWNSLPTTNGKAADLVLGQANFDSGSGNRGGSIAANTLFSPRNAFSDGNRLLVADADNNRVLIWNNFPTTNGQAADVVVGSSSMNGGGTGCLQNRFAFPTGVTIYDGKLFVSDASNRRVLIFNSVPTANGANADLVLGQTGFSTCSNNGATSSSIPSPQDVFVNGNGKLFVTDTTNHRVLIWNSIPTENNKAADNVVGQTSFTSSSTGTTASTLGAAQRGIFVSNTRLFVPDSSNNRLLIFNSVPDSNGASADIILGQASFTSSASGTTSTSFSAPGRVFEYQNKLLVSEFGNNRIMVFPNTLATPEIQVGGTEPAPEGKIQMNGNVVMGNTPTYVLNRIQASINGSGYSDVTHFGGGENLGNGQTYYPFYHQFNPWENNSPQESWEDRGYTVKFKTVNSNAEENYQFYMNPLTLNSAVSTSIPTLKFTVPKTQWDRIKENISGFSALVKPFESKTDTWTNYTGNVLTSDVTFDSSGVVTFTARPQSGLSLKKGKYYIKVQANDKWGHNQESNTLETTLTDLTGSPYNPLGLPVVGSHTWFPLQVNKITGVNTGGIITTNNLSGIKSTYSSSTTKPIFTGIAYTGATVAMNVTDQKTGKTTTYLTQATDSTWTLTPTLTGNSVINLSVYNQNSWYNELLPLVFTVSSQ